MVSRALLRGSVPDMSWVIEDKHAENDDTAGEAIPANRQSGKKVLWPRRPPPC